MRRAVVLLWLLAAVTFGSGTASFARASDEMASTVGKAPSPPLGARPDPLSVARGKILYSKLGCPACHGALGQGGAKNAADLGQSGIAVRDDKGRTLAAFLLHGRPSRGMPPAPRALTPDEAADLWARLRWVGFSEASLAGNYGGPPPPLALSGQRLSILVGDAKYGRRFFEGPIGECYSCHAVEDGEPSSAENLAHISTKYPDPKDLQDNMLLMNRQASTAPAVVANVRFEDGRVITGDLERISDFKISIRSRDGMETTIPRSGGEPKIELIDPIQAHLRLLDIYGDDDIHNLTAYLATLK